jgi:adenine deaminase
MHIKGQLVGIRERRIFPAELIIENGRIVSAREIARAPDEFILPGFIDAHVHIESSLMVPAEFARIAITHGTLAAVSDPHEIANVLGVPGIEFMTANGRQVPFYFYFGAPSCVPATGFETAGATVSASEVASLLATPDIYYLSEMMNVPGVIRHDRAVMAKIHAAHRNGKPIDGHAPGLSGEYLKKYIATGISTDHECSTLDEALEKLQGGMKILIREGSAARNFDALIPLIEEHFTRLMFCSDDKHPDSLLRGHINQLAARAVAKGYDIFKVLHAACLTPLQHYGLKHGTLQAGDPADFIIVNNLQEFRARQSYVQGEKVAEEGRCLFPSGAVTPLNHFTDSPLSESDLYHRPADPEPVIVCLDGQLLTEREDVPAAELLAQNDCLKLVVVNRYRRAKPAIDHVKNFGLKKGAIAGSVAHDSHNIIAVGTSDREICRAINLVMACRGALAACHEGEELVLPLPVAGLMSTADAWWVAGKYAELDRFCKEVLGATLQAPFMNLSFLALLVIPHLKLSDKGLFDGDTFSFLKTE